MVEWVGEEFVVFCWGEQDAGEAILLSVILDVDENAEDIFSYFFGDLCRETAL